MPGAYPDPTRDSERRPNSTLESGVSGHRAALLLDRFGWRFADPRKPVVDAGDRAEL